MGNIAKFNGTTVGLVEPRDVLDGAIEADLRFVMVIGHDIDGAFYIASSDGDVAAMSWELEKAKRALIEASGE